MNAIHTQPATKNGLDTRQSSDRLSSDLIEYFRQYAGKRPEIVALWCLGIGFVLGWKLKPW